MRVGFLGLGAIGTPMAAHVAREHDLFARACTELGESADYLEMIRLVEEQTGAEIRA